MRPVPDTDGSFGGSGRRIGFAILGAVGHLPFRFLYGVADILFALAYYIVRYRRRLVARNLAESFPEKTSQELRRIEKQFYRNLADYAVETLKLAHISDAEMRRRMTFDGVGIIDESLARGRSVTVYFSHCFNWEWAPSVTLWSRYADNSRVAFCQIYRPLRSRFSDAWFLTLRSRFGSRSLAKARSFRDLLALRRDGRLWVTGFMSDQKPSHNDPVVEVDFMGRQTPVITGTETVARKLDTTVVYWDMSKTRRGHYHITTRLITDCPRDLPEHEITRRYFAMLSETLRRQPANWLWSHNRWHHFVNLPSKE